LRTHGLLAVSSALLTVAALRLVPVVGEAGGQSDPLRVVQGIAQALGFIGAGLVFRAGGDVHNLTTAVNLWMAAAIGVVAGMGLFGLAIAGALLALAMLILVRLLARPFSLRHDEDGQAK
jgi:putative Mg2+ transporter-C (MgtC) family protein